MENLSVLPTLSSEQWDNIDDNKISGGKYNPLNWVIADNILIQGGTKGRLREKKLFEYFISLIDVKKPTRQIKVKKTDIINFLFPNTKNKKSNEFNHYYYSSAKESFDRISKSRVKIKFNNKKGTMWIPYCSIVDHEDISYIIVIFSTEILPFLCFLKGNFTKYQVGYIEKFKKKYSIDLYKYFKLKHNMQLRNKKKVVWKEDLKDLKFSLAIENTYNVFKELKNYILDPSIEEINKNTDLKVSYTVSRGGSNGRKILGIEFTAEEKYKKTSKEKSKMKPADFQLKKSIVDKTPDISNIIEENIIFTEEEKKPMQKEKAGKTQNKPKETKKKSIFGKLFGKFKKGDKNGRKK